MNNYSSFGANASFRSAFPAYLAGIVACSLALTSCGSGKKKVPGLENLNISVVSNYLYVGFLSTTLNIDAGLTLPIPGLKDATLSMAPNIDGKGTVFQLAVALKDLFQSIGGSTSGLPDGRPLPDVLNGTLPRWDVKAGGTTLSLYLNNDAFGFFIPLKFQVGNVTLPFMVSQEIRDEHQNLLGKVYAIPSNVSGSGSGLFVLLPFKGEAPKSGITSKQAPIK